ncbi:right-handed parallel beta-helix repeat-containing protein [Hymenobacter canadensis]|uniref:Right-handed parallel beta-helix repeat-containing protein n=1 Tax=Hymenobacter canadensis TaxID=2999067 RepID=A0ABY7LPW7_9BACT|nr:right-handed parallel beta-helix repeat-containing protein [Hymenobacter canadensis]WBA40928.1 right-handed parallel beta-helix repeat-containing protein [Hymenobacter canadensis]
MKHTLHLLGLLLTLGSSSAMGATIGGRVFEDVNYGGGSGAPYATTGGFAGIGGARVEIYRGNTFVTFVTTGSDGFWSYNYGTAANNNLTVRVVSSSLVSSRGTTTGLLPVVTFRRTFGNTPTSSANDLNYVGGQNPGLADAGNNTGAFNTITPVAQNQTNLPDADGNGANAENYTGIDFGFNFDVVVNTNDSGQGSLRQFVLNANALPNTGLDQRQFDNNGTPAGTNFPAGQETSIFMLADGTAKPGLRVGLANLLTDASGVAATTNSRALITLATALPALSADDTALDGTTQTTLNSSNPLLLGTGGTVGVDRVTLAQVPGPEVELSLPDGSTGITLSANNLIVRGLAIHGGSTSLQATAGTNLLVEDNALGITAFSVAAPATRPTGTIIVSLRNPSGIVRRNILAYSGSSNLNYSGSGSGYTITRNEFVHAGRTTAGGDNISVGDQGTAGPLTITENLIRDSNSSGIQFEIGAIGNNLVNNNTISGNGKGGTNSRLEGSGIHYLLRADGRTSTNTDVISRNIINANQSSAIVINYGQRNVQVTQNSIYGNGDGTTGGQGLIAIDFTPPSYRVGGNAAYGQGDGVTPNDGIPDLSKANGGMNYPIITRKNVTTVGANTILHVEGFVGRQSNQTQFGGSVVEFFRGDNTTDTNQNGEIFVGDGQTFPHGEPRDFIGSLTTGADGSFNQDITFPTANLSPALQTSDPINSTAFKAGYGTSESGINLIPNTIPPGALPVTLTSFRAACAAGGVLVSWQTATELNNAGFEVQRSLDGTQFRPIAFVAGTGTSSSGRSYSLTTDATAPSTAYYRLHQLDTDGTASFSPVEVVVCEAPATSRLVLTPNPARQAVEVLGGIGTVQLLDLTGRVLRQQAVEAGSLNLQGLAPGMYVVRSGNATARLLVE